MTYTISLGLQAFTCDSCGSTFGVPRSYYDRWEVGDVEKSRTIYCCCCGHRWTCGETAQARLERQLAVERASHDQTRAARDEWRRMEHERSRQLSATKGVVTRTKRRISHGVCPCCTRTFQNLREHMKNQHPAYQATPDV